MSAKERSFLESVLCICNAAGTCVGCMTTATIRENFGTQGVSYIESRFIEKIRQERSDAETRADRAENRLALLRTAKRKAAEGKPEGRKPGRPPKVKPVPAAEGGTPAESPETPAAAGA